MAVRKANAEWSGDLKTGKGTLSSETKVLMNVPYDAASRFESGNNSNPEELLAAAHAACYSMALAHSLSTAGYKVNSITTEDKVHLEKKEAGFTITKIEINTVGMVDKIDEAEFKKHAETTKSNCPVSRAMTGVEKILTATLKR